MKKGLVFIAALILIGGAVLYLKRDKEHSDIVVITTQDAPTQITAPNNRPLTNSTSTDIKSETNVAQKDMAVNDKGNEELQEELKEAIAELPTIEEIRSLSEEELHHTPPMVRDGGALVGKKLELAQAQPERRPETLKFLLECAEKDELAPAVRALCWHRLLNKIPEWKVFVPISDAKVPDDIKTLSTKLDSR